MTHDITPSNCVSKFFEHIFSSSINKESHIKQTYYQNFIEIVQSIPKLLFVSRFTSPTKWTVIKDLMTVEPKFLFKCNWDSNTSTYYVEEKQFPFFIKIYLSAFVAAKASLQICLHNPLIGRLSWVREGKVPRNQN